MSTCKWRSAFSTLICEHKFCGSQISCTQSGSESVKKHDSLSLGTHSKIVDVRCTEKLPVHWERRSHFLTNVYIILSTLLCIQVLSLYSFLLQCQRLSDKFVLTAYCRFPATSLCSPANNSLLSLISLPGFNMQWHPLLTKPHSLFELLNWRVGVTERSEQCARVWREARGLRQRGGRRVLAAEECSDLTHEWFDCFFSVWSFERMGSRVTKRIQIVPVVAFHDGKRW